MKNYIKKNYLLLIVIALLIRVGMGIIFFKGDTDEVGMQELRQLKQDSISLKETKEKTEAKLTVQRLTVATTEFILSGQIEAYENNQAAIKKIESGIYYYKKSLGIEQQ